MYNMLFIDKESSGDILNKVNKFICKKYIFSNLFSEIPNLSLGLVYKLLIDGQILFLITL